MSHIPGPRTHPTVKPLVTMNRQNLKAWELRLGIIQVVILLGLVTGSLACSFYLGFFTGQRTGFEIALNSTENNAVKLPIDFMDESEEHINTDMSSELYAKLSDDKTVELQTPKELQKKSADSARKEFPELKAIKTTGLSPIENDTDWGTLKDDKGNNLKATEKLNTTQLNTTAQTDKSAKPSMVNNAKTASDGVIRILGDGKVDDSNREGTKTLGALLKENVSNTTTTKQRETQESLKIAADRENTLSRGTVGDSATEQTKQGSEALANANQVKVAAADISSKKSNKEIAAVDSVTTKKALAGADSRGTEARVVAPSSKTYVAKSIPRGWFAQVGAPTKREDGELLASKLTSSGFRVVVENANVRGQSYYRVLVGPEAKREQAERLVSQLKGEKYLSGEPFLRLVK